MPKREDDLSVITEVYVQPGESYFAREPTLIRTVLGSTSFSER